MSMVYSVHRQHLLRTHRGFAASLRVSAPLLLTTLWVGCTKDEPTAPAHSPQLLTAARTVTGRILGPDGRNICRTIGGGTITVYLINPDFDGTNDAFFGVQDITCPDNSFSLAQNAPTAHLRVQLPLDVNLDNLPWRTLEEFSVPAGGTNHPVHIVEGSPLQGRALFEGAPIEGAPILVVYDGLPQFEATDGGSGPNGRWQEFFGRSPMILQNDVRYQVFGCEGGVLGAKQSAGFPEAPFLFPSGREGLTCRLETAPTTEFSHTATRLAVTPMPGDIGGAVSGDLFGQYGVGWGVQFPVPIGSTPAHGPVFLSHMFNGGLLLGFPAQDGNPPRTLSGVDVGSAGMECGINCRDLGFDGVVTFSPTGASGERKSVTWRYSDAGSGDAIGIQVIQHSIDGFRPHDYVLFRFRIRNTSPSTLRFFAGFFGDLDIQPDPFDDLGATALDGRLMYQVSGTHRDTYVGTVLLGDVPVTGNYFFSGDQVPPSIPQQVRALRGGLTRTSAGPGDLRYIQGAGPITLDQHEAKDLWLAVVAGGNRSQLIANAKAAQAKVAQLINTQMSDAGETMIMTTVRATRRATHACKNCRPAK